MLRTLADPAKAEQIAAAVLDQATHFDMIGLQLGYCYDQGALARDAQPPAAIEDPSVFEADGSVGARLPHAWLDDRTSTLDLIGYGEMTLLSFGAHDRWAEACDAVEAPVRHVRVGVDVSGSAQWQTQCRIDVDGALLVRPDQHIAWRSASAAAPGPGELEAALSRILDR